MKKANYLFALCTVLSLPLFAHGPDEAKFYLDSANIKVMPEGLFLELDDGLLPIEGVNKDEQGVYVTARGESAQIIYCLRCELTFDLETQSPNCPHLKLKKR